MITCKEDLINTYVDHTNSELFSAWFELVKDIVDKDGVSIHWLKQNKYCSVESGKSGELFVNSIDGIWLKGKRELTLSDLKPTKQYTVPHKGGSYQFQSYNPVGDDVVACFDLVHSEKPLSEDFFDEKPRTEVEYELIKFESTAGAYRAMLDGEKLYSQDGESEFIFDGKNFVGIDSDGGVYTLECHSDNEPFYRRIETEIDERQEFIDEYVFQRNEFAKQNTTDDFCEFLADSGKFKLVN